MSNNTLEAMTKQQIYHKKNREKCLEKVKWYYEENKDRLLKISCGWYNAHRKKKSRWRCADVFLINPNTSRVHFKWNTQQCLARTSPRRYVYMTSWRNVAITSQECVTRTNHWNVSTVFQTSLKWSFKRRLWSTLPRCLLSHKNIVATSPRYLNRLSHSHVSKTSQCQILYVQWRLGGTCPSSLWITLLWRRLGTSLRRYLFMTSNW